MGDDRRFETVRKINGDNANPRDFWRRLSANEGFKGRVQPRQLLASQEMQLMTGAPWGPEA
jgi:hypothetical protein